MPRKPQQTGNAGGAAKQTSPPLWVLVVLAALFLIAAIVLLLNSSERRQVVVASYVLFSLVVAIVTFGILQSTGTVKRKDLQLGGAIVGFVVVLVLLLNVPYDATSNATLDVVGDLYIDGIPPQTAKICLLETNLRDNCQNLGVSNKGRFVFLGVGAGQDSVRLEVTLDESLLPEVVVRQFIPGRPIRLDLHMADFRVRDGTSTKINTADVLHTCRPDLAEGSELFYVFDLDNNANLDAKKCNEFLNLLTHKLQNGIYEHLASYQLLADVPVEVIRCTSVLVRQKAEAEAAGRALGAPGVIWGYAEEKSGQVESSLHFTVLARRPITLDTGASVTSSFADLANVEQPVDGLFLALVSYLLGQRYISEGKIDLARRCLLHAKELDVLSGEIEEELEQALDSLGGTSPTCSLKPIG